MRHTRRASHPLGERRINNLKLLERFKSLHRFAVALALLASGCSGASGAGAPITPNGDSLPMATEGGREHRPPQPSPTPTASVTASATTSPVSRDQQYIAVASLGMAPLANRTAVSVKSYGATGNGTTDDTAAIQRAFDTVPTGDILTFPTGTYRYSSVLTLKTNNVILEGMGGVLQAKTAANQEINLAGNEQTMLNMTIVGTGSSRLTSNEASQVVVSGRFDQVVGNNISGGPVTGLTAYGSTDFRFTGNKINRDLAGGIYITNNTANVGAQRGLVENNSINSQGDDGIAVVSYVGATVSGHVLINNNTVLNNVSGRNISCVGCDTVAITNNVVSGNPTNAGIIVAQETGGNNTLGDRGVLVKNNSISNIEMGEPNGFTGNAAIEIDSAGSYPISYVSVEANTVNNSGADGVRAIDYGNQPSDITYVNFNGNVVTNIESGWTPLEFVGSSNAPSKATCYNDTYNGSPFSVAGCAATDLTSAAWSQFNFVSPEGTTWATGV
jgi:hypothetical protein